MKLILTTSIHNNLLTYLTRQLINSSMYVLMRIQVKLIHSLSYIIITNFKFMYEHLCICNNKRPLGHNLPVSISLECDF